MRASFQPDTVFLAGSHPLVSLELCEVRLQDDARWPWLMLLPRIAGAVEIEDLAAFDRARLVEEAVLAGVAVRAMGVAQGRPVEKLNVGALGNLTPQLHVHVVGRRRDDPAWPGPVWGFGEACPCKPDRLALLREVALRALSVG